MVCFAVVFDKGTQCPAKRAKYIRQTGVRVLLNLLFFRYTTYIWSVQLLWACQSADILLSWVTLNSPLEERLDFVAFRATVNALQLTFALRKKPSYEPLKIRDDMQRENG